MLLKVFNYFLSFINFFLAIESSIYNNEIQFLNPKLLLLKLSYIFEEVVGGTSGAVILN